MTRLLEKALEQVSKLPESEQDAMAAIVLTQILRTAGVNDRIEGYGRLFREF